MTLHNSNFGAFETALSSHGVYECIVNMISCTDSLKQKKNNHGNANIFPYCNGLIVLNKWIVC